MASLLTPALMTVTLTGVTFILLAAWLFVIGSRSAAHRIFALMLIARGWTFVNASIRQAIEHEAVEAVLIDTIAVTHVFVVALTLWFLAHYPKRRTWFATHVAGRTLFWTLTLGLAIALFLDPSLNRTTVDGQTVYGPLIIITGLRLPVLGLAALVLAVDHARAPGGSAGYSRLLILAGFALRALYDGAIAVFEYGDLLAEGQLPAWDHVLMALRVATLLPAVGAVAIVARTARRSDHGAVKRSAMRFASFAAPLPVLSAGLSWGVEQFGWMGGSENQFLTMFMFGLWSLVLPLLVTYALLRFQLFGIDLRVKAGVRRTVLMSVFTLTFFVVSETAEALIAGDQGPAFGIGAAGLLAVASRPVESLSESAANGLMPSVKPLHELSAKERRDFYRNQFRLVHEDGKVTAKERRMLDQLGGRLGLQRAELTRLEAEVVQ